MRVPESLYFFLIVAFVGFCLLFLAGYLRYRGKPGLIFYFLGALLIGVGFINVSAVKPADINVFVIFIWLLLHLFISWLIVEGSTRLFLLRNKRRWDQEQDIIPKDPDRWFPNI